MEQGRLERERRLKRSMELVLRPAQEDSASEGQVAAVLGVQQMLEEWQFVHQKLRPFYEEGQGV